MLYYEQPVDYKSSLDDVYPIECVIFLLYFSSETKDVMVSHLNCDLTERFKDLDLLTLSFIVN